MSDHNHKRAVMVFGTWRLLKKIGLAEGATIVHVEKPDEDGKYKKLSEDEIREHIS